MCNNQQGKCGVVAAVLLVLALLLVLAQVYLSPGWNLETAFVANVSPQFVNHTRQVLPQFIIAGVRKCGTRALLQFLHLHAHVQTAVGEIHFFDIDTNYENGLEWYRLQMPGSEPYQLTTEKTPGYFIAEKSPLRIKHMNSSIRLLFIVRDPVTRMISDYVQIKTHRIQQNLTQTESFEDLAIKSPSGRVNTQYKALKISLYHIHLQRWLRHFNRSQLHIVDGEALIKDPLPELKKVEEFLGLEHQFSREMFYLNKTRGFYCMETKQKTMCLGQSKGRPHPSIDPVVWAKLCLFFKPHNEIFFKLAGQHFEWC